MKPIELANVVLHLSAEGTNNIAHILKLIIMKTIAKFIVLYIIILLLGLLVVSGEYVYDSIGIFGPIILIGLLIVFLLNAFKN